MGTHTSLDVLRTAPTLLAGIRIADDLAVAANRDGGARAVRLLAESALASGEGADQLSAIAAIHALAQVFDESADDVLVKLLSDERPFAREHAAWAFSARLPRFDAFAHLIGMIIDGGFIGMIAQRTLEQWSAIAADHLALALEGALIGVTEVGARERLIETVGLVPGRIADRLIRRAAFDADVPTLVRVAALAALGDRPADSSVIQLLERVIASDAELSPVARLALHDLLGTAVAPTSPRAGLTVAQLFLHADIDGQLSRVGSGDNGGIATLLVRIGDALADRTVSRVVTLSRGSHVDSLDFINGTSRTGHEFAPVPFAGPTLSLAAAWPRRIQAQRGIRRILKAVGPIDAIHLRMADVGTLAAHTVARELDIPVVFTIAPDPHTTIRGLESKGELSRLNFGDADSQEI